MTEILLSNDERMYELLRDDDGILRLNVVVGDIGMYELSVVLTEQETATFAEEGPSFIEDLAYQVARAPSAYRTRSVPDDHGALG